MAYADARARKTPPRFGESRRGEGRVADWGPHAVGPGASSSPTRCSGFMPQRNSQTAMGCSVSGATAQFERRGDPHAVVAASSYE
ncbi:hypothetical protein E2562_029241 [Oryza meyeriana var. granulata]|uniref:Uncharacterized protein n=1 Tax=Oryza meyeriana var. granulata TaxID=110450 RepID=A0A6G1EQV1_9ORYZ|nr:hypothetical protein E2562_029241 [Oryza meyeriana var. granulata]